MEASRAAADPRDEVKQDGPFDELDDPTDELDDPENGNWGNVSPHLKDTTSSMQRSEPGSQSSGKPASKARGTTCSAFTCVVDFPFASISSSELCLPTIEKGPEDAVAQSESRAGTFWLSEGAQLAASVKKFSSYHGPNRVGRLVVIRHREAGVLRGVKAGEVTYSLHVDSRSPPLLWARKWRKSRVAQYVISADPEDLRKERQKRGPGYVGKLKNVNGDQRVYSLFDGGEKSNLTRRELAAVVYTHERAATDTLAEPKMEVAVPAVKYCPTASSQEPSSSPVGSGGGAKEAAQGSGWSASIPPSSLRDMFFKSRWQGSENHLNADTMTVLREAMGGEENTPASASSDLVFGANAIPSVKNFRLHLALPATPGLRAQVRAAAGGTSACDSAQAIPLLRMDKAAQDEFVLRFTQPFSVLQAFGVALSRFDTKQVK